MKIKTELLIIIHYKNQKPLFNNLQVFKFRYDIPYFHSNTINNVNNFKIKTHFNKFVKSFKFKWRNCNKINQYATNKSKRDVFFCQMSVGMQIKKLLNKCTENFFK